MDNNMTLYELLGLSELPEPHKCKECDYLYHIDFSKRIYFCGSNTGELIKPVRLKQIACKFFKKRT